MYVFEQAQSQKYGKIFLVFQEIREKMEQKKERANKICLITPFYLPL